MAQATFLYGNPLMIPYTAVTAIAAGDVIVSGAKCFIAHTPIAAGELGSVAAGGGVYIVTKAAASGNDFAIGEKAYFNDSTDVADDLASGNTALGWFVEVANDIDTTCKVQHGAF